MRSKKCVALVICGVLGVVLLAVGCALIHVFSNLIHNEVVDNIPLKEGSKSFKLWADPSSPIYFQVWMFDVANHLEVMQGEKPFLVQKGPYTYREKKHKFNITYNSNGTLSYRERSTYVFQPDMSAGSENDTFMCINIPLLTIYELTRWEPIPIKFAINLVLNAFGESLFQRLSVHDLMWGYEIKFLKEINKIVHLGISDVFGLFYNRNNSDDGLYQIYSGLDGVQKFGQIVTWNEESELTYWTSNISNAINGSDGTIYPPFVDTADTKYLFSSDLCRSLGLTYTEGVNVRGIDLNKFVAPDILFGNLSVNPYNAGFCTPAGHCLPSGLLNVSLCRQDAPVIFSMPHFLGCDESVQNGVIGLSPNREEHQSYVDVEPTTGVTMNVGKRIQINTYIERIDGYSSTYNIKTVVLPVMWLNESAMISESDAADFKSEVLDKIRLTKIVQYTMIGIGALMIVVVIIIVVILKKRSKLERKEYVAINDENSPLLIPASQSS